VVAEKAITLKNDHPCSFFKGEGLWWWCWWCRELLPSKTSIQARLQGWREVLVPVDAKSIHPRKQVRMLVSREGVVLTRFRGEWLVLASDWQGYGKPSGSGGKGSKGRDQGRHLATLEKPLPLTGVSRVWMYYIFMYLY